ncbi:MAG: DNA polymerase III subunit gamma/tau, partial [Burkholderiales bacterium]|nr:DNA polymerase III subunit gamma/tau [Burkholderiales bacterium]
ARPAGGAAAPAQAAGVQAEAAQRAAGPKAAEPSPPDGPAAADPVAVRPPHAPYAAVSRSAGADPAPRAEESQRAAAAAPGPQRAAEPEAATPRAEAPEPQRSAEPAPSPASNVAADSALGDRWQTLVLALSERGAVTALARELAWQAGLAAIDEGAEPPRWRLVVERESLRSQGLVDKLTAALAAEIGAALVLEVEPGIPDDSPARRDAAERSRLQVAAEAAIRDDPLVQALMSQFKSARIVPGSIKPL